MLIQSAAMMAMSEKGKQQDLSIYNHAMSLQIQISARTADAIRDTSLTFSELCKEDYKSEIETIEGVNVSHKNAIPRSSNAFNEIFHCKAEQVRATKNYLQVHFIIKSEQALIKIKDQLFHYLKDNHLLLKQSPGPASRKNLITLCMITNIPRESSLANVLKDIKITIANTILKAQTNNINGTSSLADIKLPCNASLDVYLHKSKVS